MDLALKPSMVLAWRLFLWATKEVMGATEPTWLLTDFDLRPKSLPFRTEDDGRVYNRNYTAHGVFQDYVHKPLIVSVEMAISCHTPGAWFCSYGGVRVILTSPPIDRSLYFLVTKGLISKTSS